MLNAKTSVMSGDKLECFKEANVSINVCDQQLQLRCVVAPGMIKSYQLLLSMDAITQIGCITFQHGKTKLL